MTVPTSEQAAIAKRIATYIPTVLAAELWARHGDEIRAIVTGVGPRSVEDAKSLLVALSKLAAWRHTQGLPLARLRDRIDDTAINTYGAHVAATSAWRTAVNELGRLRRIHRALNGLPEPHPARPRPGHTTPYSADEIDAFIALDDPTLTRAVELALTTGTVVPAAHDHPGGYTRADWQHARRAARSTGTPFDSRRLHATWAHHQAHRPVPALELLRSGLTPTELDAIARAAGPVSPAQLALAR